MTKKNPCISYRVFDRVYGCTIAEVIYNHRRWMTEKGNERKKSNATYEICNTKIVKQRSVCISYPVISIKFIKFDRCLNLYVLTFYFTHWQSLFCLCLSVCCPRPNCGKFVQRFWECIFGSIGEKWSIHLKDIYGTLYGIYINDIVISKIMKRFPFKKAEK